MHQWLGGEMVQQILCVPVSVQLLVEQAGTQLSAVQRHARRRLPGHRGRSQSPKRRGGVGCLGIGGPGNSGHGIVLAAVAKDATLEGRSHPRVDGSGSLCRFEWEGVSTEHGIIMRMSVIALAWIVLLKARIIHSKWVVGQVGGTHRVTI